MYVPDLIGKVSPAEESNVTFECALHFDAQFQSPTDFMWYVNTGDGQEPFYRPGYDQRRRVLTIGNVTSGNEGLYDCLICYGIQCFSADYYLYVQGMNHEIVCLCMLM